MAEAKPSAGAWLSRGILGGLLLVCMYLAAMGPANWLHVHGPSAWQGAIEFVYIPVILVLESERLPDWMTGPFLTWVGWWG